MEETCHYQRGRGMRKFGEAESAQMAPRSSSLLFSSFERRRHLTKGDRERGDGDKRGVVFHATTLQTTPPPTLTKKRVARCADRPPPLRLHGSAPPHLPAFPFSRAVFLYSPIDKDPRGGGSFLPLKRGEFSRYALTFIILVFTRHVRSTSWRIVSRFLSSLFLDRLKHGRSLSIERRIYICIRFVGGGGY